MGTRAILALADGRVFEGVSIGAERVMCGEVVFNTSMTGYQEILTDPSYALQFVTLTYPHIGNVGVNADDCESKHCWASGLICKDVPRVHSSWRAESDLQSYLKFHDRIGIAGLDTRALTHHICERGAQQGCLMAGEIDVDKAIALARDADSLEGLDLAKEVCTDEIYTWDQPTLKLNQDFVVPDKKHKVVVYDYGVKHQILRLLVDRGCEVIVVPAQTPVEEVLKHQPDGVLLSNGPGDPAACDYAILSIQRLLQTDLPLFGICLGFQLLALACGAKTLKMKYGHHGANHPVQDLQSQRVMITSQNHGFAVDEQSLPSELITTHRSLFDNTLQGFQHKTKPVFGFQGHPEASPGPTDIESLFDRFKENLHG